VEKNSACSKATKSTPTEGAGTSYKGRSARKRIEKSGEKESSMCGKVTRSAVRVEEKLSSRIKEESRGALQQGSTRRSMPTRVRMVYKRSNSDIHAVQKI